MDALKKLDLFPKTIDDFRVKTATGGILSLLSISLMLILFIAELRSFYTPVRLIVFVIKIIFYPIVYIFSKITYFRKL